MKFFKGAMLAAGVATLATSIKNSINAYAGLSDELAKNSRQVGILVESFQGLQFAAGIQGVSTDTLQTNLEKFSLSMGNVRTSQSAMAKSLKNQILNF